VEHMSTQYGFKANERMYKKRIIEWDLRRNLKWHEREAICKSGVVKQAQLGGHKDTKIVVRGQERRVALFLRHMKKSIRGAKLMPQSSSTAVMDVELTGLPAGSRYPTLQQTFTAAPTIRCQMYPSDDRRNLEIICQQTSYLFKVGTHDFPLQKKICVICLMLQQSMWTNTAIKKLESWSVGQESGFEHA
jgi:hypothetical protein